MLFRRPKKLPPTSSVELEGNSDGVLKSIDLLKFKVEDAFNEKILTDKQIITHVNQLTFHATRVRDLIKDNQNETASK